MDKILAILCFILGLAMLLFAFPEGNVALLATVILAGLAVFIIRKQFPVDSDFLVRVFLLGLIARVSFGLLVHVFDLREFFGGDAETYDRLADKVVKVWFGYSSASDVYTSRDMLRLEGIGWGMSYFLAFIYSIVGRNILAAQFIYAVIGAAISPLLYTCSNMIFNNRRVGQVAAILAALYPAFIIWTGQLLKDGLIIFLLVLVMAMVLSLQKKFSYSAVLLLIFGLFGIISLRFYIFYMIAVAVAGTFIVGLGGSTQSIARRIVVLVILGLSMTYLGVIRYANTEFERYGSLESVQRSRSDAANRSDSGFGEDIDVRTSQGAILAIPVGFTYLMLAPFPWQVANFRQMITLPDMLIWWFSIPFLISGLIYSIRFRLKGSLGILIFSLMLSMVYSIFQGNVGTAYRQRTQIQVFLFIFIGVGWTLFLEKRENQKSVKLMKQRRMENRLRDRSNEESNQDPSK